MEKIRVLYADGNKKYKDLVEEKISQDENLELVGVVGDGQVALNIIKEKRPHVVIVDTVLPMIDGLGVLEQLNIEYGDTMPSVIVVSSIINKEGLITRATDDLGAKYFMAKPYDLDILVRRIKEVATDYGENVLVDFNEKKSDYRYLMNKSENVNSKNEDINKSRGKNRAEIIESFISNHDDNLVDKVTDILDGLGAPVHLKGYGYLRDAIVMVADNEGYLEGATKYLYPEIAKKYNATSPRVERAIRHAVSVVFERGKKENLETIFTLPARKKKPTNLEFIAVLAQRVKEENEG